MAQRGRVKWFNNQNGWGFIAVEGGPDVYVHHSRMQGNGFKTLQEGDEVDFESCDGDRGPYADHVVLVAPRGTQPQERAS